MVIGSAGLGILDSLGSEFWFLDGHSGKKMVAQDKELETARQH